MKTALIHHLSDEAGGEGIVRWLSSFSEVVAVVKIDEPGQRRWKRLRREWKRSGVLRLVDVAAFRLYYKLRMAADDRAWLAAAHQRVHDTYPAPVTPPEVLVTRSPNTAEVEEFLRRRAPDLVIARCKSLLRESVFSIPPLGTFVMHPGICPMYRNSHGCFWAMAAGDYENVGMTLLKIDRGIDTGPIFGHYRCEFDPLADSHVKIQMRAVIDNLEQVKQKLLEIEAGAARTIDTRGWPSRECGQPWLSAYLRYRRAARAGSRR